MRCSALFAIAGVAACSNDPPIIAVKAEAAREAELISPDAVRVAHATYRWDLVVKPAASVTPRVVGDDIAIFIADVRGDYLVDRWMQSGVSDDLTDEFVIEVAGIPPQAVIDLSGTPSIGATLTFDATASHSAEGRTLTYRWRLASRPRGSQVDLLSDAGVTSSLVPDVAGDFIVELDAFDGELWSSPPASLTISVPP